MKRLGGRVAFVTGGSRGLGKAIACKLAAEGATVALTYKSARSQAAKVVDMINQGGGRATALRMAVEDRRSVNSAVKNVVGAYGRIDILINNAGIAHEKPFLEISDSEWEHMLRVNLQGAFSCCQEIIPNMVAKRWGRIVNISSVGGQIGGINQVHYAAAKAGLISLTRSLARLYSNVGITTNAVAVGLVLTDMSGAEIESSIGLQKLQRIPMARIGTPNEVAETACFLVSDGASYITGHTVNVNGGLYLG